LIQVDQLEEASIKQNLLSNFRVIIFTTSLMWSTLSNGEKK